MKSFLAAFALLAAGASPALAQSDAQHILEAVFQSFDENHDGYVSTAEANRFIDKTFHDMDPKHTGRITPQAWMSFSFGLADLAADQGRSDAYDRAKAEIFKRWDVRGDHVLTLEDYRAGVLGDARKALGETATQGGDMRLDFAAFQRAPFVRALMKSLR
jgi:Ca2+-binding EF-hand superfamily protein